MDIFGLSDIGKKRESNQDSFFCYKINQKECCAFVCDGMGGSNGGEIASNMVKEIFSKMIVEKLKEQKTNQEIKDLVFSCYEKANKEIFEKAILDNFLKGMGTTCVTVVLKEDCLMIFNVGDSRVYLNSTFGLKQLSVDHSYVQTLVDCGEITKEQAKLHPRKNEITKAVGISEKIKIDYIETKVEKNNVILLCTDGLTNNCSDEQIRLIVNNKKKTSEAVEKLIETANFNGGDDNITVVLITV